MRLPSSAKPLVFVCLALLILLFARYGTADHYYYYLMLSNNPAAMAADHVLNGNIIFKASVLYPLNRFLRIEDGEALLLALYFAISAGSLFITYLILRRHLHADHVSALFLLLVLLFVDKKINTNAWSLLFPVHPASPSMFGNFFAVLSLYLLLEKKIIFAFISIWCVVAFQVKENVILLPGALLFISMLDRRYWWRSLGVILPLSYLLLKSSTDILYALSYLEMVDASYQEMVDALHLNIQIEGKDGSFLIHTPVANALLLATIIASFPLSNLYRNHFKYLLRAFALATLAIYIFNVLYLQVLWPLIPDSRFIFIGAVRNTRFFILLFFIAAMGAIALRSTLHSHEKAAAMLALILLHGESWKGIAYPLIVVVAGIGLPRLVAKISSFKPLFLGLTRFPWMVWAASLFLLYAVGQFLAGGVYRDAFIYDKLAFEYAGRFSAYTLPDRAGWGALRSVRSIEGGGPFLAIFRNQNGIYEYETYANTYARKAQFNHGACYCWNPTPDYFKEAEARAAVEKTILGDLNRSRTVTEESLRFLRQRGVWILAPEDTLPLLRPYDHPQRLGTYILWRPSPT